MFKSRCDYLLKQAERGYYEEIFDGLEDLFWEICSERMRMELWLLDSIESILWMWTLERQLEHIIWGWYPKSKTFSARYER